MAVILVYAHFFVEKEGEPAVLCYIRAFGKPDSERRLGNERRAVKKLIALLSWSTLSFGGPSGVTLGPTVSTFAVLGGSTVTNTGSSVIVGNVGVSPGTSITGFPPGTVSSGNIFLAGATAGQAQSDLTTAFNTAMGLPCPGGNVLTGTDLGGLTLSPGVYCFSSSAQLTGTLILNGGGNANAQFIFQIFSTLTTATGSVVSLINSAQAANVFWEVGSSATIGTATAFAGNVMASASITLNTNATLAGRALASSGAVTLAGNAVGIPGLPGSPAPGVPVPVPQTPGPTPIPSSLILVAMGLACAGMYRARELLLSLLRGN
jgi:hypothetical protein